MRISDFINEDTEINEEMSDTQAFKAAEKLKSSFKFEKLKPGLWQDKETIKASGLTVDAMDTHFVPYNKKIDDFHNALSKSNLKSIKATEHLMVAKEAIKYLKSHTSAIMKLDKKIRNAVTKAGDKRSKDEVTKINQSWKEKVKSKIEKNKEV